MMIMTIILVIIITIQSQLGESNFVELEILEPYFEYVVDDV